MMRLLGVVALAVTGVAAAPAAGSELTPDGPATLMNRWTGASTLEGRPPEVLVGVRVSVGAGGREGTVRVRARSASSAPSVAGDPVVLPAVPGTYDFAAPHVEFDPRSGDVGLDQTAGGHAIVEVSACTPELGKWADLCQLWWLDASPLAADAPVQSRGGSRLAITPVVEVDGDQDLRGDQTEDRTDLRARLASVINLGARIASTITVTNAGPLDADLLTLETTRPEGFEGSWRHECGRPGLSLFNGSEQCVVGRLAAGATRTFTFESERPAEGTVKILARSEGADLRPGDNEAVLTGGPIDQPPTAPPATVVKPELTTARTQSLRKGLRIALRGEGRTRVTAAFKVRGRTVRLARTVTLRRGVERTLTLRAHGAKLRTLRRAAARGALRATITVSNANGSATATARVR